MHIRDAILNDIFGERISENISIDNNGQLICANCVLARTGYYDYLESELFDGGSDTKVIKVYRSPEEVFAPESIRSMNFKPLVDDHPEGNVTPDSVTSLSKGFMANVRRGDGEYSESLMGDLVVTDPEVIELIQTKNKRDLSVGYTCDIEEKDGKYFMKNIRGNHIALCKAGRAGNARIRDSRVVDAKPLDREGNVLSVGTKVFIYRGGNNEGKVGTVKTIKNVSEYGSDFEVEYNGVVTKHSSEDLIKDSRFAKGSFAGIGDMQSHFNNSTLVVDGDSVLVTADGRRLEYKVLGDAGGRLVLVNDSSISNGAALVKDSLLQVENTLSAFGFMPYDVYSKSSGTKRFQAWKYRDSHLDTYSAFLGVVDRIREVYPSLVTSSSSADSPVWTISVDFGKYLNDSVKVDEVYSKFVDEADAALYEGVELTGSRDECSTKRMGDAALSPANIKLSNGSIVNFYGWADKNGYGASYYSVGEKTRGGFVFHAHFETESLAKRFLSSFNNPSALVVRSAIGVTKSVVVDSHKRMFKVRVGDKEYGVRAYDHTDAVRKVRDSQRYIVYAPDTYNGRTALCYKRQGKAQYSEFSRADRFSKEEAERIEGFKGGYSWEKRLVEY